MKKTKFLWSLMALPLLAASCSDKDVLNSGSGTDKIPEGEGVYITVNFTPFDKGTRSYTDGDNSSSGGNEEGTNQGENGTVNENKINSVLLVLATTDNKFIAHAKVDNTNDSKLEANNSQETLYQATAVFEKDKIQQYYNLQEVQNYIESAKDKDNPNPPVRIFLYCNPTQSIIDYFASLKTYDTEWVNETYSLTDNTDETGKIVQDNSLWTQGRFLMTNESIAKRYFPFDPNTWNQFNTSSNAFDLSGMNNRNQFNQVNNYTDGGSITVHRVAARFDFRDGSQGINGGEPLGNGIKNSPYTYSVIQDANNNTLVKAKIITMSLVNMLKSGYYLERVSTGTAPTDWTTSYSSEKPFGYQLLEPEKQWFASASSLSDPKGGNYVVTPYPSERLGSALSSTNDYAKYYKYPLFTDEGTVSTRGLGWYTTYMNEFDKDIEHTTFPLDNLNGNYVRWRYVTENTMAGGESGQINAATTGIVFRAQLLPGEALETNSNSGTQNYNYWDAQLNTTLSSTDSNGPVIFAYSNNLYVSWKHVQYAALRSAGYVVGTETQNLDRTGTFYKAVFGNGGVGTVETTTDKGVSINFTDNLEQDTNSANYYHSLISDHDGDDPNTETTEWDNFRSKVVANDFTIYEKYLEDTSGDNNRDSWGYYCYYYYWNRHNDNGDNSDMVPMEFAVVRNNVYKLAVTKLSRLGHPRLPENDPDSPDPEDPDEKADLYMTVSVQVLPWEVRINDIEF